MKWLSLWALWDGTLPYLGALCIGWLLVSLALHLLPPGSTLGQSCATAYELVSLPYLAYMVYLGVTGYFLHDTGSIFADRIYGTSKTAKDLALVMIAYQTWNTMICIMLPTERSVVSIVHHVITGALCGTAKFPFMNYYCLVFMGVSEASTVALAIMNLLKSMQKAGSSWSLAYQASRVVFVVVFICVRIGVWLPASGIFWYDTLSSVYEGRHHAHGIHISWFILFWVSNIGLTSLQLIWARRIIKNAHGGVGGGKCK